VTKCIINPTDIDTYRFLTMKLKLERELEHDNSRMFSLDRIAKILNGQKANVPNEVKMKANSCHRFYSFLANPYHEELLDEIFKRHITVFPISASALGCSGEGVIHTIVSL